MEFQVRLLAILLVIGLSACASSLPIAQLDPHNIDPSAQFIGPSGGAAYLMTCFDGVGCYKRAREVCSGGYTIFDSIDTSGGTGGMTSSSHYIAFECKK